MAKQQQQTQDLTQDRTGQPEAVGPEKGKIGEGALKAAFRQGGKELDQVWAAFPANSSVQVVQEPGNIWNPPSMDVSNQTGATRRAAEVRDTMHQEKQQAQKPRDIEPEMDPG